MENMDRVAYAHSVETGNIDYNTAFINYFDQLMGLYGLIRPHNYHTEISSSENNNLLLNLRFSEEISNDKIKDIISTSGGVMSIYGRNFKYFINNITNNIIQLSITE